MNTKIIRNENFVSEDEKMIRKTVFMDEQGFSYDFDEIDQKSTHLVLYYNNAPVACLRYFKNGEAFTIGRVAVLMNYRKKSFGTIIMEYAINDIKSMGYDVVLSAQLQAKGFYESLGFKSLDDLHYEEGCPHVSMKK